jgi:transcriptional regulator with XRE-family HTH domain
MFTGNLKIKDIKVEIGQLVKTLRKNEKLPQKELADKLGISRITLQNLEKGENFTIDTLLKILQHFELSLEFNDFFKMKIEEHTNNKPLY